MSIVIKRREFLGGALALGAAGAFGGQLGSLLGSSAGAAITPTVASSDRTLVICTLYGGNDGLNTVVPYEDPIYYSIRSNIALAPDTLHDLGGGLGLHPALRSLAALWDAGQVAIVRGVGYPDQSLSHFQAMSIWQSASPSGDVASGWLGRWLDKTKGGPLQACSVGPTVPPVVAGEVRQASAVQDSTSGSSQLPDAPRELLRAFRELQRSRPGRTPIENAIADSGVEMLETSRDFAMALDTEPMPSLPSGVDSGDIGTQLDIVSSLIRADLPTQVYSVSQSDYDTHSGELEGQAPLLAQLDAAIGSFFSSLAGHPKGAGTTLVIYTEFGRRVDSNGSGGTDHGTANDVYVIGPSVAGGFYGDQPSLSSLDENGNLIYNIDFRSVYATVLEHVIGVDSKPFLGRNFPLLGFI